MPPTLSYPGVYIEEIPSGVRTITGVATSITAFIGSALRGPLNDPIDIHSYADFERTFGGLWMASTLGYAVQQYFLNGGTEALIVRVAGAGAAKATLSLPGPGGPLGLEAASEGDWGKRLSATVDLDTDPSKPNTFNLLIQEVDPATGKALSAELFRNLSFDPASPRFVTRVLAAGSTLVEVDGAVPVPAPAQIPNAGTTAANPDGADGAVPVFSDYEGILADKTGIYALEKADLFNLLCIPPFQRDVDVAPSTWVNALAYCQSRRALLLVDAPSGWLTVKNVTDPTGLAALTAGGLVDSNAALYFPQIRAADPLRENQLADFAPCGAVAGVFARTDSQRGVWKAPAGLDAKLLGAQELTVKLTDLEQGNLNPLGVNCLRTFPVTGNVVWGARTLAGADRLASEWKYVPVRRLALFLEESLYRGTQWVVFEPNDEPLWAQIRLNVGAFMHDLFRQGAFQGSSPRDAYLVKCDQETTTQTDIDHGIVNIVVGFAPLKPAEFVVIQIQQLAGQIQT